MKYRFEMLPGEYWWGGTVADGCDMPFSEKTTGYERNFCLEAPNQTMPLYLSSKGRYIWSEEPFKVCIDGGAFIMEGQGITLCQAGETLRDAYLHASRTHFPFTGKLPPEVFFRTAQYNTWMEYTYNPTQEKVLAYAHGIIDNGFVPGVLIIDEGWHRPYGDWRFDAEKFPDPKAMMDELHALGFIVMLWVVPFATCSGLHYVSAVRDDLNPEGWDKVFMRDENGDPLVINWWNGMGVLLDFENPVDAAYLEKQLQALVDDYGVDGFKFDGGSLEAYSPASEVSGHHRGTRAGIYRAWEKNIAWNEFGARFTYHEYKDTFKGGGKPVIQRLQDRRHKWVDGGINTILPNSLAQGLLGHPFVCPDMIGGGEWADNHLASVPFDEELFIRMAQVSVFFPMMQFSWAPWRVLSPEGLNIVRGCAALHAAMADELLAILRDSAATGEPVIRTLEYQYPHCGYEDVKDEFLCGDNILVCPVVTKGTRMKEMIFPAGDWVSPEGEVYHEGRHMVATPPDRLAWFRRK